MYAFVRFFEDDMCYALPVSNVEDFRPLHRTDFDNQKVYLVHRAEQNGSAGQPCEAQILALAGKLLSLSLVFLPTPRLGFFTPRSTDPRKYETCQSVQT